MGMSRAQSIAELRNSFHPYNGLNKRMERDDSAITFSLTGFSGCERTRMGLLP